MSSKIIAKSNNSKKILSTIIAISGMTAHDLALASNSASISNYGLKATLVSNDAGSIGDIDINNLPQDSMLVSTIDHHIDRLASKYKITNINTRDLNNKISTFLNFLTDVESTNNPMATNKDSSATGAYQFLTDGKDNSVDTALNRLINSIGRDNISSQMISSLRGNSNYILELPHQDLSALATANLFMANKSDTHWRDLITATSPEEIEVAFVGLYKKHHTDLKAKGVMANVNSKIKKYVNQLASSPKSIKISNKI